GGSRAGGGVPRDDARRPHRRPPGVAPRAGGDGRRGTARRRADGRLAPRAERPSPRARHATRRLRGARAGRGAPRRTRCGDVRGLLLSRLARGTGGAGALGRRRRPRPGPGMTGSLELSLVEGSREPFLPLLLEADESEPAVRSYLEEGELFAILSDGVVAGEMLVLRDGEEMEIKSIAVAEDLRGRGIGRGAIELLAERAAASGVG